MENSNNKKNKLPSLKVLGAVGLISFISVTSYQMIVGYEFLYAAGVGSLCGLGIAVLALMPNIVESNKFKEEYYGIRKREIKEQTIPTSEKNSKTIDKELTTDEKIDYLKESKNSFTQETLKKKILKLERFK